MDKVPDHLFIKCPVCGKSFYNKKIGAYKLCPNCGYGFRLGAQERIDMTVDEYSKT